MQVTLFERRRPVLLPAALFCALLAIAAAAVQSETLVGKVIGVHDGDTLTLLIDKKKIVKVRLEAIDAPELGQPFGSHSKQALSNLCFGKQVRVESSGEDRYGRTLGRVFAGDLNVTQRLVEVGSAWHYSQYSDSRELAESEARARKDRLGLWAAGGAIAPWEWRKTEKERRQAASKPKPAAAPDEPQPEASPALDHWLNTSTNVRHNSGCRYFENTKRGRLCTGAEGKACGVCGG